MNTGRAYFTFALFLCACGAPMEGVRLDRGRPVSAQADYVAVDLFVRFPFTPPPAPDSDAHQADIATVRAWQAKRTVADCERADQRFIVTFDSLWGENSPFPKPLPDDVQLFFDQIDSNIGAITRIMKDRYQRPRPEISNPCSGRNSRLAKSGSTAYPSGHASISRVFAKVLADLVPDRKGEFLARADDIAQDRVIIGVHYPSDITAGKILGDLFHAELINCETYQNDLNKIQNILIKR